ncbi:helix-turn-helix domain-containing protein [Solimonas marina]|uniref:Helix-turn-helix domain-containing protein n=1 Tax=Solimonas marina TaxID=2714601 RepID=A0A969WDS6_9GAMM|nr:RodZ domain-containing protein [Solimonas marina]NKF24704.1 helix-turn-helix domain-containing protein [Solimonas marina]
MMTETPENEAAPDAAAAPSGPVSPGTMIREARQAQHLSVDDLAAHTKLARTTVEALERDDFGALLEPVYVRGYYRKCAKVLGIDEKAMLDEYASRVAQRVPQAPAKLRLASGTDLGSNSRLPMTMGVLLVLVAIVVCGFIWWLRGTTTGALPQSLSLPDSGAPSTHGEAPPPPASASGSAAPLAPFAATDGNAPSPSADAPAAADAATRTPADAAAGSSSAPADAATPDVAPTTAAPTPAAASDTPPPAGNGSLALRFTQASWVRIKDATGRTLLSGTIGAGETHTLAGSAPFDLLIGNAPGVRIDYDGKSVDMQSLTRDSGTAHFQLPGAQPIGQ